MQLFVYGTLMRGFSRAHALSRSQYLGNGYIQGELYNIGRFPGVIEGKDHIVGELYETPDESLNLLDQIEGYDPEFSPNCLYIRKSCTVYLDTGEITTATAYFYNRPVVDKEKIVHGDYRAFVLQMGDYLDPYQGYSR